MSKSAIFTIAFESIEIYDLSAKLEIERKEEDEL